MRTIIEIYFAINIFYAGFCIGEEHAPVWKALLYLFFWVPMAIGYLFAAIGGEIWRWLDRKTYVPFWVGYIVGAWDGIPVKNLTDLNKRAISGKGLTVRGKRRWEYLLPLVNKRNGWIKEDHITDVWVPELDSWVDNDHEFSEYAAQLVDEYCQELSGQAGMTRPVNEEDSWEAEGCEFMWGDQASRLILSKVDDFVNIGLKYFPDGEIDIMQHMNQYKEV